MPFTRNTVITAAAVVGAAALAVHFGARGRQMLHAAQQPPDTPKAAEEGKLAVCFSAEGGALRQEVLYPHARGIVYYYEDGEKSEILDPGKTRKGTIILTSDSGIFLDASLVCGMVKPEDLKANPAANDAAPQKPPSRGGIIPKSPGVIEI